MNLQVFIKRPILALVCSSVIALGGVVCIPSLPVAQFPDLAPPQVAVSTVYTGADARTVEAAVTVPLEKEINGVDGLSYLSSTSSNDGTSLITATFAVGRDPDKASVDVQNRVNAVLGRLPAAVRAAGITVSRTTSDFVFGAGVYAQNNEYDTLFLSNYVDRYVRDRLKRIPGVGGVVVFGERKYSMRLWLDPEKLASRALAVSDVVNALNEQNIEIPAGQIGGPPTSRAQQFQVSVRAAGRLTEPAEFENVIVKTTADGTQVRLQDIGRAELGAESYDTVLEFDGRNAVGVAVAQLPGANRLRVYRDCLAELDRLSKSFPPGMKVKLAFDSTQIVSASIGDTAWTLGAAVALVVAVMFVFLPDWRTTIVPAAAIPVSLLGTLAFVKLFGFSINSLTLFGITLATGLVVDDAILVVENVQRHRSASAGTRQAVITTMGEVAGAVVSTSFVLIAVFIPVAMLPGTTGILFRQFALTIAASLAISTFNALTLSPALCAALLGAPSGRKSRWRNAVDRLFEGMTARYRSGLTRVMRVRIAAPAIFAAGLILTYALYQRVPSGFVPQEDQGFFITMVQAPQGASLDHTARVSRQVQQVLSSQPEVVGVFAISGFGFAGNAPNRAVIFSPLKPIADRRGSRHSAAAVIERVRGALMGIPGAIVVPFAPPAVAGLGNVGGFQMVVQDLRGSTLDELSRATEQLVGRATERGSVTQLFSSFSANEPQLLVSIDREKAKRLQVPLTQISDALQVYMGSSYVNDFDFNNRAYRVYVQADHRFRERAAAIGEFTVRSNTGQMISLDNLVRLTPTTTAPVISHHNLFRSAEISGAPAPGHASGEAIAAMEASAAGLPRGFAYEWIGLTREEIESRGQSMLLFAAGLLFVYLALAAQYESLSLPFIVILAVPMALVGAFAGLSLRGMVNDVYCQIGLVMLIGLASKNAILIVEFAEHLRARGLSPVDAAIEAAVIRLRPILMTSLAFVCGVIPLVTATGAGEAAKQVVGTTVLGGMVASTFLNLFLTPVLYVVVAGASSFVLRAAAVLRAQPVTPGDEALADGDLG